MVEKNSGLRTYISAGSVFMGYPMLKGNSIDITP